MIRFLCIGLLRDKAKSFFPLLVVMIGVMLTVVFFSWINGIEDNMLETNARLGSGHVQITSRAYALAADQIPNDLALKGIGNLLAKLQQEFGEFTWTARIRFGGFLDVPDEKGETKTQGPVIGIAANILSPSSPEQRILNLKSALLRGRLPQKNGEILIADEFATNLKIRPGDKVTLISNTMYGSITTANFILAGTFHFGTPALDRGMMVADIADIQNALDMTDTAGEILGFLHTGFYDDLKTEGTTIRFNALFSKAEDPFSPLMDTLIHRSGIMAWIKYVRVIVNICVLVFMIPMFIVLWNMGLMGNIRRYGEVGVRLAMGEAKSHVYSTLLAEAAIIGFFGSLLGTILGLVISYYLQAHGLDISSMMKNATMLVSTTFRARVTGVSFFIGFVPGLVATILGAAMAGRAIFKRQTAHLLKELEA